MGSSARRFLLLSLLLVFCPPAAFALQPSLSFKSPFLATQCDSALSAALRGLERDRRDVQNLTLLGEALLCRGLEDDPGSLDLAITVFGAIRKAAPDDFHVRLQLADAVRRRFPLSPDAYSLLLDVQKALAIADVGAAREELGSYIDENLRAVASLRSRAPTLPTQESASAFQQCEEAPQRMMEISTSWHRQGHRAFATR